MNNFNFDEIEFARNADPRIPIVFLLDTSDSMSMPDSQGRVPLEELDGALDILISELYKDPLSKRRAELSVVSYGTKVGEPTPFATVENVSIPTLEKSGLTSTGEALLVGLDMLEERKKQYRENGVQYYRPMMILLSDGLATDNTAEASKRLKKEVEMKKLTFMPIAIGGFDADELTKLSGKTALSLKELNFAELFQWLSASVSSVSASQPGDVVKAPSGIEEWAEL